MIRAGYLSSEDRVDLIALARNGSAAHRFARRANALVLLDDGWSCQRVAAALFLDDDTIRRWHALFLEDGLEGLTRFDSGGGASRLSKMQEEVLKSWIGEVLPRSTRKSARISNANSASSMRAARGSSPCCTGLGSHTASPRRSGTSSMWRSSRRSLRPMSSF